MSGFSFLGATYIATSVFGITVILVDFLGLLGHELDDGQTDGPGSTDDASAQDGIDDHGDIADSTTEAADDGGADHHAALHQDSDDHNHADHPAESYTADVHGLLVLRALRRLRSLVFFSVGFGPIGLLALWKGYEVTSLMWSIPSGIASLYIVRRIMRLQTAEVDSSLHPEDLLLRKATVLVPLSKGSMGKVRIPVDMGVSDQYALPLHDDESFEKNEVVYIANVGDECVYVESEARTLQVKTPE